MPHNNMHFLECPYFLQGMSPVERALVAKVTTCQRIHLLRQGMASAKGHCLSIPNTMRVAATLPALASEVGFVVLRRRNSQNSLKMYQVKRRVVHAALEGLRNGAGGKTAREWAALSASERAKYVRVPTAARRAEHSAERLESCTALGDWAGKAGCRDINCKVGRCHGCGDAVEYFLPKLAPNVYWASVTVDSERLDKLPDDGDLPGVQEIEVDDMPEEEDRGPAEKQLELSQADGRQAAERMEAGAADEADDVAEGADGEGDEGDESVTTSGLICPRDPRSLDKELQAALTRLLGSGAADMVREGQVAVGDWQREEGAPIRELSTEGFFTMLAPWIFVNGSCDLTILRHEKPELGAWIEHIYWAGDGRVAADPTLKFTLLSLKQRKLALEQGSYCVAQQVSHLGHNLSAFLASAPSISSPCPPLNRSLPPPPPSNSSLSSCSLSPRVASSTMLISASMSSGRSWRQAMTPSPGSSSPLPQTSSTPTPTGAKRSASSTPFTTFGC